MSINIIDRIKWAFGLKKNGFNPSRFKSSYTGSLHKAWAKKGFFQRRWVRIVLISLLSLIGIVVAVMGIWFYTQIIVPLPDINKILTLRLAEATKITDKYGTILYKLFDENRQNVYFSEISPKMIQAIIAVEDQDFWTNDGVDYFGIMRAAKNNIMRTIGVSDTSYQWASTITQQLIKNLFTNADQTVKRKLQEFVLTQQIYGVLKAQLLKEQPNIPSSQIKNKVKEKIMELYLNYIFLGNNAYGIETASRMYFGTSALHLDTLQASILASIPKSPSSVNPYGGKIRLMGKLLVKQWEESVELTESLKKVIIEKISTDLKQINLTNKTDNNYFSTLIRWLVSFQLTHEGQQYTVSYQQGRKDYSLERMFEEKYITAEELKDAFIEWLDYQFQRSVGTIKAPHFVERVTSYLQTNSFDWLEFDKEQLVRGWYTIKTSLDYNIQQMAESSFQENIKVINGYGANNSSMVYADSLSGDILAYVWSLDYNSDEIDGKVDMVQRPKQVWSSIKPFVYALGISGLWLTLDTPMFDIPLRMWNNTPNNADGSFQWLIPLRKALAGSRNITAVKMYTAVWWEDKIKPFFEALWITTLKKDKNYWYPLSLWSAEMRLIDITNAYMHLSAMGKPGKINPILEIRDMNNNIIYTKKVEKQKQVIPSGVAYMIRKILSDTDNLPPTRVRTFLLSWIRTAHKSGTTDIKMPNGKQLPRDWLLAIYTPSRVAMFWWGNTEWQPMKANAYGWWLHGNVWKSFFGKMMKAGLIKSEEPRPIEVKNVSISKISWRLPSDTTPESHIISSLAYIGNMPKWFDSAIKTVQVDMMCRWKASDITPSDELVMAYIITPSTFMPGRNDIADITRRRQQASLLAFTGSAEDPVNKRLSYNVSNILLEEPKEICPDRKEAPQDESIQIELMNPQWGGLIGKSFSARYSVNASSDIAFVKFAINDISIWEFSYKNRKSLTDTKTIRVYEWLAPGTVYLTITVVDQDGKSNKKIVELQYVQEDTTKPFLYENRVSVQQTDRWRRATMLFSDTVSSIKGWKISWNGNVLTTFEWNTASFLIEKTMSVTYTVTDAAGNVTTEKIDVVVPWSADSIVKPESSVTGNVVE